MESCAAGTFVTSPPFTVGLEVTSFALSDGSFDGVVVEFEAGAAVVSLPSALVLSGEKGEELMEASWLLLLCQKRDLSVLFFSTW